MSAGIAAVAFALKTFREHATLTRTTGSGLRNISITVDRSFADGSCCGAWPPDTLLESATQPSVAIAHRCHAPDVMCASLRTYAVSDSDSGSDSGCRRCHKSAQAPARQT